MILKQYLYFEFKRENSDCIDAVFVELSEINTMHVENGDTVFITMKDGCTMIYTNISNLMITWE